MSTDIQRVCIREGCNNVITDAKRPTRKLYCQEYCIKRTWDLKNRTPKKFQTQ